MSGTVFCCGLWSDGKSWVNGYNVMVNIGFG